MVNFDLNKRLLKNFDGENFIFISIDPKKKLPKNNLKILKF